MSDLRHLAIQADQRERVHRVAHRPLAAAPAGLDAMLVLRLSVRRRRRRPDAGGGRSGRLPYRVDD